MHARMQARTPARSIACVHTHLHTHNHPCVPACLRVRVCTVRARVHAWLTRTLAGVTPSLLLRKPLLNSQFVLRRIKLLDVADKAGTEEKVL